MKFLFMYIAYISVSLSLFIFMVGIAVFKPKLFTDSIYPWYGNYTMCQWWVQKDTHYQSEVCKWHQNNPAKKFRKEDEDYCKQLNIVDEKRCNNIQLNLAYKKGEIFFSLPKEP